MDGEAIFFTGRGKAGEARPKINGLGPGVSGNDIWEFGNGNGNG